MIVVLIVTARQIANTIGSGKRSTWIRLGKFRLCSVLASATGYVSKPTGVAQARQKRPHASAWKD
jgi:hypothetical protein